MPRTHYFPDDRVPYTWDAGHEPVLTIQSGDTVVVTTRDVSDDQIAPDSEESIVAALDHGAPGALHISEIVDAGRYVVSARRPEAIVALGI